MHYTKHVAGRGLGPMVVVALLLLFPASSRGADGERDVRTGIVKIYTTYQGADYAQPWKKLDQGTRTGSGCVLPGNVVLTNAHVVSEATFLQVRRAGRAEKYTAKVKVVSHELDLALLEVESEAFFEGATALELGELPQIGDTVTALGFPSGATRITLTEGIVSQIDRGYYSHSYQSNLVCQIDAAINGGSSGGPVVGEDGKIVGVAFQTGRGENEGFMVPAPVVRHFFHDLEDGTLDGAPTVPFAWQVMENRQLREHYGVPEPRRGVLISDIAPHFATEGKLREKDVLLSIDGENIAADGSIVFRPGERITFLYAWDRHHVGDSVPLLVLRDGEPKRIDLRLDQSKTGYGALVPRMQYGRQPTYYIVGGLVFSPLTSNYLRVFSGWGDVPAPMKRYYNAMRTAANQSRKQVVVLIDYLPDELNAGFDFEDSIVRSVNGKKIESMQDLVEAFETLEGKRHRVVLERYDWELVLDREGLEEKSRTILERYGVPSDRSPDLR